MPPSANINELVTFRALNFGALNFGALNVGGLILWRADTLAIKNFGELNFGALNFGELNFGELYFGELKLWRADFTCLTACLVVRCEASASVPDIEERPPSCRRVFIIQTFHMNKKPSVSIPPSRYPGQSRDLSWPVEQP